MQYFEQLRLTYFAKARDAQRRAFHATDPVTADAWRRMAKGYEELAAECDFVLGREFLLQSGEWLAESEELVAKPSQPFPRVA
jgi:hypothetical protein